VLKTTMVMMMIVPDRGKGREVKCDLRLGGRPMHFTCISVPVQPGNQPTNLANHAVTIRIIPRDLQRYIYIYCLSIYLFLSISS
jgi:hypothetical protein